MASSKLPVPSQFSQDTRTYTGNLIESLTATVEQAQNRRALWLPFCGRQETVTEITLDQYNQDRAELVVITRGHEMFEDAVRCCAAGPLTLDEVLARIDLRRAS